jgi:hypothetical protein
MKFIFTFLLLTYSAFFAHSQVTLTNTNTYTENFDGLANSGTSTILPNGWLLLEAGNNANTTYTAGTGSANSGDTYSYGATNATDRAFGTLQSGSNNPTIGVAFKNSTQGALTTLTITYTGEQWRLGATARPDKLDFQYSTDATNLGNGTWIDVNNLDANAPIQSGTTGALDGNAAANKAVYTFTITGLNIPNNSTFYLRWQDFNATGSDDGIAVDDFSMSYSISGGPNDNIPPTVLNTTPAHLSTNISLNPNIAINCSEPVVKKTGNIAIKRITDNVTVFSVPVTNTNISGNTITFSASGLALGTNYFVEIPAGSFADANNNNMAFFGGANTWSFTTLFAAITTYNFPFTNCTTNLPDGFTQFNVVGPSIWGCTPFGNNNTNGVQMNGFVTGPGAQNNEDWLISPQLDLTAFNIPLLKFWSINRFNGAPIEVKISTTYSGTGNPGFALWQDLFAPLPAENSNVWSLAENINLSSFKTNNVYIAFVYKSNTTAAARWTLDDIQITNATTLPETAFYVSPNNYNFGIVEYGTTSPWQPFTLNVTEARNTVTFNAPSPDFEISTDGVNPTTSISYDINQLRTSKTFFIRAKPQKIDALNITSALTFTHNNSTTIRGTLQVSSLPTSKTLEIVNWNLDWFGKDETLADPGPWGPTDENLQEQNVKNVLRSLQADVYALVEVCDTVRLRRVVDSLNNGTNTWAFAVCNYGSGADDVNNPTFATIIKDAQKQAIIYKTSVLSNVKTRPFLRTAANYDSIRYYWSSGRLPYYVEATATIAGIQKPVSFLILHAKANTGTTAEKIESYRRRKLGIQAMKDSLDLNYSTSNIIILGDFNDDFDRTIAPITIGPDTVGTYQSFVIDSTDANHYKAITLPLSLSGQRSTVGNADVIDHVIVSDNFFPFYLQGTAALRTDVTSILGITASAYAFNTTDHYPVYTRYSFLQNAATNVVFVNVNAFKNGTVNQIQYSTNPEYNMDYFEIQKAVPNNPFITIARQASTGFASNTTNYTAVDNTPTKGLNYYRIKAVGRDGKVFYSEIKTVLFDAERQIIIAPNTVTTTLNVYTSNTNLYTKFFTIFTADGKKVSSTTSAASNIQINVGQLPAGYYFLQVNQNKTISTHRFLKQ